MSERDAGEYPIERESAREGMFDAQLTFAVPFVEAPSPLTAIVKRDGTRAPFDKRKIAGAIFRAAESIGGADRGLADSLASAVALYLAKTLQGCTPNVDQVDDAVERVLVEMGHVRTALVYTRCRERRARERRLRNGDSRTLLRELDDARRLRTQGALEDVPPLLVRTSAETLASWDRARIVDALTRETGLDVERAETIARDVEQQIMDARVRTLTAPLIRELVSAKLIEHGLEPEYRRHRRLGVPLYDTERIVRGPSPEGVPINPSVTSRTLAEAVKREFALSEVFSPEIAEAHARGEMHLHDLGGIDRLHTVRRSLSSIVRHGVGTPDSRMFSRPPKYPQTLLAQMVHATAILQEHVAGPVAWDAVNVYFAPFLDGFDQKALRQVAQMLVYEYAYRAVGQESAPVTRLGLRCSVPEDLLGQEAIGSGGQPTGIAYGGYASIARDLAWKIYEVLREGRERGTPFPAPAPELAVTDACFEDKRYAAFLANAAATASATNPMCMTFDRDQPPVDTAAHRVSLNRPPDRARGTGA
ncbi:MAG: ATP cone domain-containing protein [Candidatus Hydrogenedentes bacterium]|nr:ATP cone domain-containing protein [Candidatus Hydrogenedentota bacterium]